MIPLLLFFSAILPCASADFTVQGYDHFYNLEFDQAIESFERAAAQTPGDPQAHNHIAHGILYREMLRSGALESELVTGTNPFIRREKLKPSVEDQRRFEESIARALALTANATSAEALYAQGVSFGLRGNYNFLVRKAWIEALRDITASRKLHARVTKLDPSRVDAKLVQGVHDYVVGSLPFAYRVLGFVAGFRGDREGGIRTLREVAERGRDNRTDAEVLLAAVYRRERKPVEAIPLLQSLIARYPRNYLFRLEIVQMYSDSGDKDTALAELKALDKLKQAGGAGLARMPAEKVNFARGTLLFWYREYDAAMEQLGRVTAYRGEIDLNTRSMAWLRLGQCRDMKLERPAAVEAYRKAQQEAPDSDAARQAGEYLAKPYKRLPDR